jgi:hypothetical protein
VIGLVTDSFEITTVIDEVWNNLTRNRRRVPSVMKSDSDTDTSPLFVVHVLLDQKVLNSLTLLQSKSHPAVHSLGP